MEWGKLFASLPDNPRVQAAEADGAGWLLIESMCYCTSAESDGFIPLTQVERFGGGAAKKRKIAALLREGIWQPVENGYMLDPLIWSEDRNLNGQAERKRDADRRRIADRRAAERAAQNAQVSRDSRATQNATGGATCRSDSRTPEKRREEIPVPVVSHPSVDERGQTDDDDIDELTTAVVATVRDRTGRVITAAEASVVAGKILARAVQAGVIVHRPPRYVAAAIASEPDLYASLLLSEPPPLTEIFRIPDRGHEYDHDPATGLCRGACRAPQVDRIHRRWRTA